MQNKQGGGSYMHVAQVAEVKVYGGESHRCSAKERYDHLCSEITHIQYIKNKL